MFGDRLKELREECGYTQSYIAEYLNVTRQAISSYETNTAEPTIQSLIKMADLYNCSLDYIAGRTKDPSIKTSNKELINRVNELINEYKILK